MKLINQAENLKPLKQTYENFESKSNNVIYWSIQMSAILFYDIYVVQ